MAASLQQEFCALRDTYIEKQFGRLNDMQRQAVFTTDGPLLILAGAGSGKTTVACAVLAALKKRGADPVRSKRPDYIDHVPPLGSAGGQPQSGSVSFQQGYVRAILPLCAGHGAAVCEGAMGFYDGQGLHPCQRLGTGGYAGPAGAAGGTAQGCQRDAGRANSGPCELPQKQPCFGHLAQ